MNNKYWAFISYSSKDNRMGQWLHKRIENYSIPEDLRGSELFDGSVLGKNLRPVFRDRDELSGAADLGQAIHKALEVSRFLIVLCSPDSAQSEWVNKEIETFISMGKGDRILALILDGEPNVSTRGLEGKECFPPALRENLEPIAGDLRSDGDGRDRGFLKILAGITQLDFDILYRRHERARARRRLIMSIVTLSVAGVLAFLSVFALRQQNIAMKAEVQANKRMADLFLEEARRALHDGDSESLAILTAAAGKSDSSHPDLPYFTAAARQAWGERLLLQGHKAPVRSIDVRETGFISTDDSGLIIEWSAEGKVITTKKLFSSRATLSAPGFVSYDNGKIVTAEGEILSSGGTGHNGPVTGMLSCSEGYITVGMDGRVLLWNNAATEVVEELYRGSPVLESFIGCQDNLLVLQLIDHTTVLIRPGQREIIDHKIPANSRIIQTDEDFLVLEGNGKQIYRLSFDDNGIEYRETGMVLPIDTSEITRIALPGNGNKVLLLTREGEVLTLDNDNRGVVDRLSGIRGIRNLQTWRDSPRFCVMETENRSIILYDLFGQTTANNYAPFFSEDIGVHCLPGGQFAITSESGDILVIQTGYQGTRILFEPPESNSQEPVHYEKMLPLNNGRYLICGLNNTAMLVSSDGSMETWTLEGPSDGTVRASLYSHGEQIVIYSPWEIQIRDVKTGQLQRTINTENDGNSGGMFTFARGIGNQGLVYILADKETITGDNLWSHSQIFFQPSEDAEIQEIDSNYLYLTGAGDPEGNYWGFLRYSGVLKTYSLESGDYRGFWNTYIYHFTYAEDERVFSLGYSDGRLKFLTYDLGNLGDWPGTGSPVTASVILGESAYTGYEDGRLRSGTIEGNPEQEMTVSAAAVISIEPVGERTVLVLDSDGVLKLAAIDRKVILREMPYSGNIADFTYDELDGRVRVLLSSGHLVSFYLEEEAGKSWKWDDLLPRYREALSGNPIVYQGLSYLYPRKSNDVQTDENNKDDFTLKTPAILLDPDIPKSLNHDIRFTEGSGNKLIYVDGEGDLFLYSGRRNHRVELATFKESLFRGIPSPDGRIIATCGFFKQVYLIDVRTGKIMNTLKGHTMRIAGLSFDNTGRFLASGSRDGSARIWDVESGHLIRSIPGLESYVHSVPYLESAGMFLLRSDKRAFLYDPLADKLYDLSAVAGEEAVVRTVDYDSRTELFLLGLSDGRLLSIDLTSGQAIAVEAVYNFESSIVKVLVTPFGTLVESGGSLTVLDGKELVTAWDPHPGEGLLTWFLDEGLSRIISAGEESGILRLWDIHGKLTGQYSHNQGRSAFERITSNQSQGELAFLDDQNRLYKLDYRKIKNISIQTPGFYTRDETGRILTGEKSESGGNYGLRLEGLGSLVGNIPGGGFWGVYDDEIVLSRPERNENFRRIVSPWDDSSDELNWQIDWVQAPTADRLVVQVRDGYDRQVHIIDIKSGNQVNGMDLDGDQRVYVTESGFFLWKGQEGLFTPWADEKSWTTGALGLPVQILEASVKNQHSWIVFLLNGSVKILENSDVTASLILEGRPQQTAELAENQYLLSLDTGSTGIFTISSETETAVFKLWEESYNFQSAGLVDSDTVWMLDGNTLTTAELNNGIIKGQLSLPWPMEGAEIDSKGQLTLHSRERIVRLEKAPGM